MLIRFSRETGCQASASDGSEYADLVSGAAVHGGAGGAVTQQGDRG